MAGARDVAVTGPDRRLRIGWWATRFMLRLQGLRATRLTPGRKPAPRRVRGVIIGGGDDIEPAHYGAVGDGMAEYDVERDRFEIEVLRRALDTRVPILGICRGAQLLNVVLGGTLYQDLRPLRQQTPNRNSAFPVKAVHLASGSVLESCMGVSVVRVNSLHHQAVEQVALPLWVSARDADGFIQAVESPDHPFRVGVQWHPEYLPYRREQRALFGAFASTVRACADVISV